MCEWAEFHGGETNELLQREASRTLIVICCPSMVNFGQVQRNCNRNWLCCHRERLTHLFYPVSQKVVLATCHHTADCSSIIASVTRNPHRHNNALSNAAVLLQMQNRRSTATCSCQARPAWHSCFTCCMMAFIRIISSKYLKLVSITRCYHQFAVWVDLSKLFSGFFQALLWILA